MATVPDLPEIRGWIDAAEGQLSDEQLQRIIDAETEDQAKVCRIRAGEYPAALAAALLRRVARAAALKGIPLGVSAGSGEGSLGTSSVAALDGEIARYEGPYRRRVVG